MGVRPSAIWYELRTKTRKGRRYNAKYAEHLTRVRRTYNRTVGKRIASNSALKHYVHAYLFDDQSPENIAGRIALVDTDQESTSGRAIREYIASPYGRRIEAHREKVFGKRRGKRKKQTHLEGKRMIAERPKRINDRKGVGHLEGDFILSGRSGAGMVLDCVDRNVRHTMLELILPVSTRTVENALVRMKKRYPEMQTITFDNDILFVHHKTLEKKLRIKIYFCDPHSPWQKGSVENRNKILRRHIPKGADIAEYSRRYIQKLETYMNRRIMKCLGYLTPAEALEKHRKRKKKP